MRLTDAASAPALQVAARLDIRLPADRPAPVAVGFSGGGDSLALLLAADAWARRRGRELLVLTLDHRLQSQSADWTGACAQTAADLGRPFAALAWTGPKPDRGLPAAARKARHRLLAEAARDAGARVILLGHTADDVAEAAAMRAEGSTTPAPREWSPSPVWPQGRGLFLLRPMLNLRRTAIREWLAAQGRTWIDDPANEDLRYARSRARRAIAGLDGAAPPGPEPADDVAALAATVFAEPWGGLSFERDRLRAAPLAAARAVVAAACLCAAGTGRPPRRDRLDRLTDTVRGAGASAATLAGARIETDETTVRFMREAGDLFRSGPTSSPLAPGAPTVWDGRFELEAVHPGLVVCPLAGMTARLGKDPRKALARLPAHARGSLPAIVGDVAGPASPVLTPIDGVTWRALAAERFAAACGLVTREP